jgi:hypothetical protein
MCLFLFVSFHRIRMTKIGFGKSACLILNSFKISSKYSFTKENQGRNSTKMFEKSVYKMLDNIKGVASVEKGVGGGGVGNLGGNLPSRAGRGAPPLPLSIITVLYKDIDNLSLFAHLSICTFVPYSSILTGNLTCQHIVLLKLFI